MRSQSRRRTALLTSEQSENFLHDAMMNYNRQLISTTHLLSSCDVLLLLTLHSLQSKLPFAQQAATGRQFFRTPLPRTVQHLGYQKFRELLAPSQIRHRAIATVATTAPLRRIETFNTPKIRARVLQEGRDLVFREPLFPYLNIFLQLVSAIGYVRTEVQVGRLGSDVEEWGRTSRTCWS